MSKVSIYIPTKNRSELVRRAINSALNQDYKDLEVIVVDDGSTDDTPNMLQAMKGQDPRLVVLRNEISQGPQRARNTAIRSSSGDFVTGLDDDDEFSDGRISCLLQGWSLFTKYESNVSGVYAQDIYVVDGLEVGRSHKKGSMGFSDFPQTNHVGNQIFAPRNHYLDVGLFDESMPAWQDMELFVRMAKRFGPAKLVDLYLYRYDVTPSPDRISKSEYKVRDACRRIGLKHYEDRPIDQQRFMFHLFEDHYGFVPRWSDLVELNRLKASPTGTLRLLRKMIFNGRIIHRAGRKKVGVSPLPR